MQSDIKVLMLNTTQKIERKKKNFSQCRQLAAELTSSSRKYFQTNKVLCLLSFLYLSVFPLRQVVNIPTAATSEYTLTKVFSF